MSIPGAHAPKRENTIFFFWPSKLRPAIATAFGTMRAGPIPWNPRHILKRIVPEYTEKPAIRDHTANQNVPIKNIFLWPYMSPSLPAGRMNVPTVKLYAAKYQESSPSFVTPKVSPIMYKGAVSSSQLRAAVI
jgi:hypothetical protein